MFAGGGTGGHVYPAIAIADAVRRQVPEAAIAFAGTENKIEWRAVPKAGYAIHPITIQGFHRRQMSRNLAFPFKLAKGLWQSWQLVGNFDPDVVVGTGGYVAGPVLYAAHRRKRPIVVQEQNAFPGVTNKLLGKYAHTIHLAFEEAKRFFPADRCVLSGNPTRAILQHGERNPAKAYYDIPDDHRVLLMFGGSLGSAALNAAMEAGIQQLLQDEKLVVIWQTGSAYFEKLEARVTKHPRLRLLRYIDRMDLAYAAADLVLARAGAITCSELMVTGAPAVLVPSPNVAEDHQTKNAKSMEDAGAALLLPEENLKNNWIQTVTDLLDDPLRRNAMAAAAQALGRPDAADHIASSVLAIAGMKQ